MVTSGSDRTLRTTRLVLEPLREDDAEALFPALSDVDAMRHWHTPPHGGVSETRTTIREMIAPADACWWAIRERDGGAAIGFAGFLGTRAPAGFGYLVDPRWSGRGIATEASEAALRYGFDELGVERVEMWPLAGNTASRRVAEKLGCDVRGRALPGYPRKNAGEVVVYGRSTDVTSRAAMPADPAALLVYQVQPVLPACDVAASIAYYRDLLGFTLDFSYGEPIEYAGVSLGAWTPQALRLQLERLETGAALQPVTLVVTVGPALDGMFATFRERGATVLAEPVIRPWGTREFSIADPDGHVLRFATLG